MRPLTLDALRAAVNLPDFDHEAARGHMMPGNRAWYVRRDNPKLAAVLVLLYPDGNDWQIVLTLRSAKLSGHSGQVSFPGGKRDPEDPSFEATALRETCEELGLCEDDDFQVVGALTPLYIMPTHYEVYPTVAVTRTSPEFEPNPHEVEAVFTLPVRTLLDEKTKRTENWTFEIEGEPMRLAVPFYFVEGHKVWGATAIMLSEFEGRLRAVLTQ